MTERIRALLDEAVSGAQPRAADPVAAVVRRGRAERRRRLATIGGAGALTVALLATGGFLATHGTDPTPGPATSGGPRPVAPPLPSEPGRHQPPLPATVTDREVRVNGLVLRLPDGWQVVRDTGQPVTDCEVAPRSVLVDVKWQPGGECDARAQIRMRAWRGEGYVYPPDLPTRFSFGLTEVVLPGGQPLWLTDNDAGNFASFTKSGWAAFDAAMPWAGTGLYVEASPDQLGQVAGSVSSETVVPGRLVLPDTAAKVTLGQRGRGRNETIEGGAVERLLNQLRRLDRVVQAGDLPCASTDTLTGGWPVAGRDMAALTLSYPSGAPAAVVAISGTDDCAFATSSMGGRVWLPPGFLAEIRNLLVAGELADQVNAKERRELATPGTR